MRQTQRAIIEAATVRIESQGGQGVLVPGGLILTATHCIDWSGTGRMVLGEHYLETVTTKNGARFRVSPWFADPLTDIAALARPTIRSFPKTRRRSRRGGNQSGQSP